MLGLIGLSGPKVRGMEDGAVSDIWEDTVDLLSQSRSWVSPEMYVTELLIHYCRLKILGGNERYLRILLDSRKHIFTVKLATTNR